MTIASICIAFIVFIVSTNVSPFFTLLIATLKLIANAPILFSATSKEILVRVLASKNILITVQPSRTVKFLAGFDFIESL